MALYTYPSTVVTTIKMVVKSNEIKRNIDNN